MRCLRAVGSPSHISSPSPASTDRLIFMKVFGGRILSRGYSKGEGLRDAISGKMYDR